MKTVQITVGNHLIPETETFFCVDVDTSDLAELENAAEECVGAFCDMHSYFFADASEDELMKKYDACYYTIEEVPFND